MLLCTNEPAPIDEECETNVPESDQKEVFWSLHFNGSKTKDGVGAGCILVNPRKDKTLIACKL